MHKEQPNPLRGIYWVRNPLGYLYLQLVEWIGFLYPKRSNPKNKPLKILLCDGGHLGDLVIATSLIRVIKKAHPNCFLGFLVGNWSACVVENHPDVDRVHTMDHWKLNRAKHLSWLGKYRQYRKSKKQCLKELEAISYDTAIDLYFFFPNAAKILWQACIGSRIGYASGGWGFLYTTCLPWKSSKFFIAHYHFLLLKQLSIFAHVEVDRRPYLPSLVYKGAFPLSIDEEYAVIHMGAGDPLKKWERSKWVTVAQELEKRGKRVVFTGRGEEEKKEIQEVKRYLDKAIDICGELSFDALVQVIKGSSFILCTESVIPHISLAFSVPTVVIANAINIDSLWFYSEGNRKCITYPVSCACCLKKRGCFSMDCIRKVEAHHVIKAIDQVNGYAAQKGEKTCEYV